MYTSERCAVHMRRIFGARLINFPQTWGKQRTHGVWKGHPVHPVLFVFAQKIDQFGMRTVRGWRSAGWQSHSHIRAFCSRTVRSRFMNHSARLCIRCFRPFCTMDLKPYGTTDLRLYGTTDLRPYRFSRRITSQLQN